MNDGPRTWLVCGHWVEPSNADHCSTCLKKKLDDALLQVDGLQKEVKEWKDAAHKEREYSLGVEKNRDKHVEDLAAANRLNRAWEEAINAFCSCGGRSPNDAGVCAACRIYHHAKGIEAPHITDQRNSEKRNDEAVDCSHCSNGGKCECTGEVGPCCHCS